MFPDDVKMDLIQVGEVTANDWVKRACVITDFGLMYNCGFIVT